VVEKDGMLYIAGGVALYPDPYSNYSGPSLYPLRMHNLPPFLITNDWKIWLDTVLRSLNLANSFNTSLHSVYYVQTEKIPVTIPGLSDAAFFPTESGFDLTFGAWRPYNSKIYGKSDPPIEDRKWQYNRAPQQWTNAMVTLRNWVQTNTSRRVSSSMTAWIPSLRKGFLFGGSFVSTNGTSLNVTFLEEHDGLITYDQATNTWTNETTGLGGIISGGLVHITTATDEVLIQLGGTGAGVVCLSAHKISPGKILIVFDRENFPRSTSTVQTDHSGIPNIYHLQLQCRLLDSDSPLLSNQLRTTLAIKSTL